MTYSGQLSTRERTAAGTAAALAALGVGLGLISGIDLHVMRSVSEAITAVALPAPAPPREEPIPQDSVEKKGERQGIGHQQVREGRAGRRTQTQNPAAEAAADSRSPGAGGRKRSVGRRDTQSRTRFGCRRPWRRHRFGRLGQRNGRWHQGIVAQRCHPRQRLPEGGQPRKDRRRGRGSLHDPADGARHRMPRYPVERRRRPRRNDLPPDRGTVPFQTGDQRRRRSDRKPIWLAAKLVAGKPAMIPATECDIIANDYQ